MNRLMRQTGIVFAIICFALDVQVFLFCETVGTVMPYAHLALGSRDVQATAAFLCNAMGWKPIPAPSNVPREVAWIDISGRNDGSQQIHVIYSAEFEVSPYEREFGRHLAVFHPGQDMAALRERLTAHGAELMEPIRPTPFERFFFREPVNGYVFEVIHQEAWHEEH
ncbi:MAG: hypothetical protein RIS70_3081 [Planctomycetota bacterium]|jgi:predicted enzyme related to lactoylglutathione lyase